MTQSSSVCSVAAKLKEKKKGGTDCRPTANLLLIVGKKKNGVKNEKKKKEK